MFAALQSEEAAQLYARLGIPQEQILVSGNVKYDALNEHPVCTLTNTRPLAAWQGAPLLVAGSTHPAEETMLLRAANDILKTGTKIVFAPRHLERREEIRRTLEQSGLRFVMLSEQLPPKDTVIVCADVMGQLGYLYSLAALTFVGGSVVARGAHNLLEPAILGKTVLFGKYFFNTPDTAQALLESGGGILVSETNFKERILRLLNDPQELENTGDKARQTALRFKGATDKIMQRVTNYEQRKTA